MVDDKYYTLKEVASLLKVTYMTVFRWVKGNKVKAVKAGKQYRIRQEDLNDFINVKINK